MYCLYSRRGCALFFVYVCVFVENKLRFAPFWSQSGQTEWSQKGSEIRRVFMDSRFKNKTGIILSEQQYIHKNTQ